MKHFDITTSHILLFLILFCCTFTKGQVIELNSQSAIDSFDTTIRTVDGFLVIETTDFDDPIVDLSNLSHIEVISGGLTIQYNDSLLVVNSFSRLRKAGRLEISHNYSLLQIDSFVNIDTLQDLILVANAYLNRVNGFENLTCITGSMSIVESESLIDLSGLSSLQKVGTTFEISYSALPNLLDFNNLQSVGLLSLVNNFKLLNLDGLSNLTAINTAIWITYNDSLKNLDGLSNVSSLAIDMAYYGGLYVQNNPVLTNCCGIQRLLADTILDDRIVEIFDNPFACNSVDTILTQNCAGYYYFDGRFLVDLDGSGCDTVEVGYPHVPFLIRYENQQRQYITNVEGSFHTLQLDTGFTQIIPLGDITDRFNIVPDTAIYHLNGMENIQVNFCMTPISTFNDLRVSVIPLNAARPGFLANYKIVYENLGTNTMDGHIVLETPENVVSISDASPPADTISQNRFVWNYFQLHPFESREIQLAFLNNSPMDNPPLNGGEILNYISTIYPITDDINEIDNRFELNQEVVNSFDPNDKTCMEGNTISPEDVGNLLHYLIRFENTGTADAVNIKIIDTIDTDALDIGTFRLGSTSHNCEVEISEDVITFIMNGINLPFQDDRNDGYVSFELNTKNNLVVGDVINNSADIFFDFNFPIRTNTAQTEIKVVSIHATVKENHSSIYPNPAQDILVLKDLIPGQYTIEFRNIQGLALRDELIAHDQQAVHVNLSELPAGLYFAILQNRSGNVISHRFIKH